MRDLWQGDCLCLRHLPPSWRSPALSMVPWQACRQPQRCIKPGIEALNVGGSPRALWQGAGSRGAWAIQRRRCLQRTKAMHGVRQPFPIRAPGPRLTSVSACISGINSSARPAGSAWELSCSALLSVRANQCWPVHPTQRTLRSGTARSTCHWPLEQLHPREGLPLGMSASECCCSLPHTRRRLAERRCECPTADC